MPGVLSIETDIPKDSPCEVMGCQVHLANILFCASFISLKQMVEVSDLLSRVPVGFSVQEGVSFPFSSLLQGIGTQIVRE